MPFKNPFKKQQPAKSSDPLATFPTDKEMGAYIEGINDDAEKHGLAMCPKDKACDLCFTTYQLRDQKSFMRFMSAGASQQFGVLAAMLPATRIVAFALSFFCLGMRIGRAETEKRELEKLLSV